MPSDRSPDTVYTCESDDDCAGEVFKLVAYGGQWVRECTTCGHEAYI